MGEICCMQIFYSGWPQGVGMRFKAPKIAKHLYWNGWVSQAGLMKKWKSWSRVPGKISMRLLLSWIRNMIF